MFKNFSAKLWDSVVLPFYFIAVIWVVQLIQVIFNADFAGLGIRPLLQSGLKGILFSPLIHANWGHLLANTLPFFVLSAIVLFFYRRIAVPSFIIIYALSGFITWLLPFQLAYHIGASGVIYGLWAFILCMGIFRRNLKSIALSLIVLFYFGSMIAGIVPGQESISWQGHLAGLLAGVFTAFWYKETIEKDEEKKQYSWEQEPQQLDQPFFLDRDVFNKNKAERQREASQNEDFPSWFSNRT